jgi:hypothetical protein
LLAGCGNGVEPGKASTAAPTSQPNKEETPAKVQEVTLQVPGMAERLGLT